LEDFQYWGWVSNKKLIYKSLTGAQLSQKINDSENPISPVVALMETTHITINSFSGSKAT